MDPSNRTTLKQIARKAGVSLASVSMILRGSSRFTSATINRVKAVAVELDYKPDPALSALAAYRTRLRIRQNHSVLALLSNWNTAKGWSHFVSAQRTIEGEAAACPIAKRQG